MARASLSIDLAALTTNWRALAALAPGSETAAVVKADAYGLGLAPVARALASAGACSFFVALSEEGAALRQAVGPEPTIYVLSGHMPGDAALHRDARLVPMLNSAQQVARHFESLPGAAFGIQFDTGMNRLGLEEADWRALSADVLSRGPSLLLSHLACADEADHPMNAAQLKQFRHLTDGTGIRRSFAATGGILLGRDYQFDLTRPGVGMYGGAPFEAARTVVRLSLPVIQTRLVEPGETVGYGATWTAQRPSRVATLSGGYADGLIRAMSARATLWHGGTPCPVIGRVSMDMMAADVTDLGAEPETLDILCDAQGVDALATAAGTIGYEILTSLGARYERTYTGAPA